MSKKAEKIDLHPMRHSLAHIMAAAVRRLYPKAKFGIGPVIENGFYYDIDLPDALNPEDLPKIEKAMHEIIAEDQKFERSVIKIDEAIKLFKQKHQPYKVELMNDLKKYGTTKAKDLDREQLGVKNVEKVTTVSLYSNGDFEDLCTGPHLKSTGQAGSFKLTKVSGAYWRGDEKNPQLQRIYGVAFAGKEELAAHLHQLEEAERRDHRKLGAQLDIFLQNEMVGAGLPLFTPKGTAMINAMMQQVRELNGPDGYEEVRTGHMTRTGLYAKSGHLDKFAGSLFVIDAEDDKLALKPMNCPHHAQLYAAKLRSYRDLPVKYAEFSTLHRNEVKGALGGLTRVRALTQDDAHAFVRPDQVEAEIGKIVREIDSLMSVYGLTYRVRLSLRDPGRMKEYLGDKAVWDKAEQQLTVLAKKFKMDYEAVEGEAAFYGPKMDFLATDAIGREHQLSTIQLDFNQPERFDLSYVAEDGSRQRPVLIHRALNGTFERMLGILIEHYAGNFPVWLAPEQVRIMTVNETKKISAAAEKMQSELKAAGIRTELDVSNESVSKKIRGASLAKVPYTIVVGDKEVASGKVAPRVRADLLRKQEPAPLPFGGFVSRVISEVAERAAKSSF
ncbi:MAG TPA: threonine--tRNA ligase [Candidatus Dormibacteraeota bacterium]|nr:threonine--tRNA ligase [Candidatus Dormibacteraeota bacterium]